MGEYNDVTPCWLPDLGANYRTQQVFYSAMQLALNG